MATVMENKTQIMTANYLDAVAGLWVVLTPYALGLSENQPFLWNNIIVGLIIVVSSLIGARQIDKASGFDVVNAVLGLWVMASPWLLDLTSHELATRTSVFTGALVLGLGIWGAIASGGAAKSS